MAAFQYNERASEQAQLEQYLGPIIAGLTTGAPDCWPKINHAVNAIRVAATRAVTRAWNVVDQREATIHQLTNQINNQLLPKQYQLTRLAAQYQNLARANSKLAQQHQQQVVNLQRTNSQLSHELTIRQQHIDQLNRQLTTAQRAGHELNLERNRCSEQLTVANVNLKIARNDDNSCFARLTECLKPRRCG